MSTTPALTRIVICDEEEVARITIAPTETGCSVRIVWWDEDPYHLVRNLADQGIAVTPMQHAQYADAWSVSFELDSPAVEAAKQMFTVCGSTEGEDWQLTTPVHFYRTASDDITIAAFEEDGLLMIQVNREPLVMDGAHWKRYRDRILANMRLRELGLMVRDAHDSGIAVTLPLDVNQAEVELELLRCYA